MVGIETAAALPDDVVLEVLVRVADVATLFRCATVCKLWRRLIADCSFLRRRWPEVLGRAARACDEWSDIDDSTSYFTIDACSDDGDVSLTKLTLPLPAIKPTFEYFHMAGLDGALSLYFLYTEMKEGLGLEIWTRGKGADWYLARVVELRQRIEGVLYLWPGEKSDTLLINSDAEDMYVAYLDTGAVEKITSEFHGLTTDDAVPMEIDWQSLFMSRLGGP
ncbi:hypothetical protein VPH35_055980 [Triticum aestivum]